MKKNKTMSQNLRLHEKDPIINYNIYCFNIIIEPISTHKILVSHYTITRAGVTIFATLKVQRHLFDVMRYETVRRLPSYELFSLSAGPKLVKLLTLYTITIRIYILSSLCLCVLNINVKIMINI